MEDIKLCVNIDNMMKHRHLVTIQLLHSKYKNTITIMTLHCLSIRVPAYKCQTIQSTKNCNNIIQ